MQILSRILAFRSFVTSAFFSFAIYFVFRFILLGIFVVSTQIESEFLFQIFQNRHVYINSRGK